jgi:restriction system protein
MADISVPTFDRLMNPVIQALKQLGGSGTIEEINNKVTS